MHAGSATDADASSATAPALMDMDSVPARSSSVQSPVVSEAVAAMAKPSPAPGSSTSASPHANAQSAAGQGATARSSKASAGLKRGFFAKPAKPKEIATLKPHRAAAGEGTAAGTSAADKAQHSQVVQTQGTAFTGNIVEHAVDTDVPRAALSPANASETVDRSVAPPTDSATQPQKHVSKFKQARAAKKGW